MTKRICADRTCRDCGVDIEDQPPRQRRCSQCILDVMRRAFLEPLVPFPGPRAPWLCRCIRCGAEVTPTYGNIASGASGGCRECGIAKTADQCRLSAEEAEASAQAAGLKPLEPYRNVDTPWLSECQACGAQVTPTLRNIRNGHHGCKYCVGKGQDPGEAVEIMRMARLEPRVPYPGNQTPWLSTCLECGREVTPQLMAIKAGHRGCRWCGNSGFRAAENAVVYLLTHDGYDAAKVGIMHSGSIRLRDHRSQGWDVVLMLHVSGPVALATERAVLDWWRDDLGLPPHLGREDMPFSGWTETVCASEIDLAYTMRFMRKFAA